MTQRLNITVDDSTSGLLGQVGEKRQSGYISRLVQDAWQRWQDGLGTLAQSGWKAPEILAACDALNGLWLVGMYRSPGSVAMELQDDAQLNGLCEKWDISPDRWGDLITQLRDSWPLMIALCDVSAEFWRDNAACEAAIRRVV